MKIQIRNRIIMFKRCKSRFQSISITLNRFQTFEISFLWWMYNSSCTIRTAAVKMLWKTLCSFMTLWCGIASNHLLHKEHKLLQTWSGSEEAQEHVRTDRLTSINLINSFLSLSLLDHYENLFVTQMCNFGLFRKNWLWKLRIPSRIIPEL